MNEAEQAVPDLLMDLLLIRFLLVAILDEGHAAMAGSIWLYGSHERVSPRSVFVHVFIDRGTASECSSGGFCKLGHSADLSFLRI